MVYTMFALLHQIESATTTEQLQELLSSEEFLSVCFECGYTKPHTQVSVEDKEDVIRIIALDYLVYRVQAEIDQLAEGLQVAGILKVLRDNPEECSALFCGGKIKLTAISFAELLDPIYSDHGSNNREVEEAVMFNLEMLLQKVELGGKLLQFADKSMMVAILQ